VVSPGSIDTSRANPEWYQGRVPNAAGIPWAQGTSTDRRHLPVPGHRRQRFHHRPDHPRERRRRVLLTSPPFSPERGRGS
jgi:hypothetical protein